MQSNAEQRLSPAETYLSYVSPLLLRQLGSPAGLTLPHVETIPGTVALIDVERFSAFAERMAARGSDGVEQLSIRINDTFAVVVEAIERYGGIAHSFPGDSVIALWPSDTRSPAESALLASRCALELLEVHRDSDLPLKAGLSAGDVRIAHVGGVNGRLQLLLSGEPLDRMGRAEERASRGRLIVTDEAWRLISEHAVGAADADGYFEVKKLRTAAPTAAPSLSLPAGAPPDLVERVCAYMPSALLRQLDAGHSAWLGEFRELATMFIQIRTGAAGDGLAAAHRAYCEIQRVLFRHGGDITRFAHDDKGLAVLAVFGLPPASSEDMARRAVLAALEIEQQAPGHEFQCRIGIATGRMFCGTLGAPRRREYSVVGSTANLAARLMQSVESGTLCDTATRLAAVSVCRFESAGRLRPKGFPDAIDVFRAVASGASAGAAPRLSEPVSQGLVGRRREFERLADWIDRLRERPGALAILQGEAGIGKSALLAMGVAHARDAGFEVVHAQCDAVQSTSSYAAWARVLSALLHLQAAGSDVERAGAVRTALDAAGVADDFVPLVAPVLGIDIAENETTLEMTGSARGETLLALLARLLSHLTTRRRDGGDVVLVVLEDVHWLDAASWELLGVIVRSFEANPVGIVMTVRAETTPAASEWHSFASSAEVERIQLSPLTQSETRDFALRLLHAKELSQQLLNLVYDRTRGNPFFCEQLVTALAESAIIGVEAGVASLRIRNPEQAESLVPRSVAEVVTSRLDRLPAPVQLTLKTASVIGTHFMLTVLVAIHPMHLDEETLLAHLRSAIELGLIEEEDTSAGTHGFRHAITGDVAYEMLLTSQRRQLHHDVAEYLSTHDTTPEAKASLFYHWRRSGDERRALEYVDEAGAQAMRNGNYHAVTELYGYALETLASHDDTAPAPRNGEAPREARWSGHLGEAQVAIGIHDAARSSLEQCLETLGETVPGAMPLLGAAVLRESARQLYHRLFPSRTEAARAFESPRLSLAANTYEQLGYVYYSAGETTRGLFAALRILNLAELAGLPDLMARSYAVMSLTASVIGQRRLAALYDRRAVRLSRETNDALAGAYVGWITGVRASGEAKWNLIAMRVEPALHTARHAGDRRLEIMCLQTLGWPPYVAGDVERMTELADAQLVLARESNNRLWEAWGLNSHSEACLMAGDFRTVIRNSQRALEVLAEECDRAEEVRSLGLLSVSLLRLHRNDEALAAAHRSLALIRKTEMTNVSMYEGFAGACETLTGLAEQAFARNRAIPKTLRRDANRAADTFARFAKKFPVGRARAHAIRARLVILDGRAEAARTEFNRALRAADDYEMPNEKGLALLVSARSAALDPEQRRRNAEEAAGLLRSGEALRQARALLEERNV